MDLYTLNEYFLANEIVDEFVSAIWTERYSKAGDVQIVVPATVANITKLKEGNFLALRGSKEVMLLETQSIEKNLLTVTGQTLPTFLNQRFAWFKNPASAAVDQRIAEYVDSTRKPGQFIADVVDKLVINTVPFTDGWTPANLTWDKEEIPFLTLGAVDASGTAQRLTLPIGPLYDSIEAIATQFGVGISLYLDSASPIDGYSLKFKTYQGVDHTTGGAGALVRLTPDLDSLADVKEINSNSNYKNVVYVYYQGAITKFLAEPSLPEPEGFARRVMVRDAEGAPVGTGTYQVYGGVYGSSWTKTYVTPTDVTAFLEQTAKDAFANNNYIHALDGQTSPISEFTYGEDYGLGDLIELENFTGTIAKARVTEYIRSQDKFGEKEYPTISVVS